MSKMKIIHTVLLMLSIAFAVTKSIAEFESGSADIEDYSDNLFDDTC